MTGCPHDWLSSLTARIMAAQIVTASFVMEPAS